MQAPHERHEPAPPARWAKASLLRVHFRRTPITVTLALALGGLLGGCKGTPAPAPLRLLEAKTGIEVTWPDVDVDAGAWPKVDPIELRGFPAPGKLARVQPADATGDRDTRMALLAPGGSRQRFALTLPAKPVLRLGLTTFPRPDGADVALRFRATVEPQAGSPAVVLDETRSTTSTGGWKDIEAPLDRFAGHAVTLELAVEVAPGAPLSWGAWAAPEIVSLEGQPAGYNVVLISLDTLRADHLGCYGHERPTSPNLDRLASRSVLFKTAVSQSPWTRPSHRAMLTGLYPASNRGFQSPPISRALWSAGYRTTAFVGGGNVDHRFGFSNGFETFRTTDWMRRKETLEEWLRTSPSRKSFLFLHTYEIHDPYEHTDFTQGIERGRIGNKFSKRDWDGYHGRVEPAEKSYIEALYDGDVKFADSQVGAFLDGLEAKGLLARTIIIVTSDHGEQFWEHGSWRHGQNMYDHQLLVPLIVHLPMALRKELAARSGKEVPAKIEDVVRLVDLYPTILDLLSLPVEHPVQGRSIKPLLAGDSLPELDAFAENTNVGDEKKALRSRRFKFVVSYPRGAKRQRGASERVELYDLVKDPHEQRDLSAEKPELILALSQRLDVIRQGRNEDALDEELPDGVPAELREQLEALGYVGD